MFKYIIYNLSTLKWVTFEKYLSESEKLNSLFFPTFSLICTAQMWECKRIVDESYLGFDKATRNCNKTPIHFITSLGN